jgi:hypothetical protein
MWMALGLGLIGLIGMVGLLLWYACAVAGRSEDALEAARAREAAKHERVAIHCNRCRREIRHLTYWQATKAAKAQGWLIADGVRICPECQP